jgi:hypothetical protein
MMKQRWAGGPHSESFQFHWHSGVVEPTVMTRTELTARESEYTREYKASQDRQLCSFCSSDDRLDDR